jgi:hypothetical protein
MTSVRASTFGSATRPRTVILLMVLIINLVLVSPYLMPEYADFNPYDEAQYIASGRGLVEGQLRGLEWGPLVSIVYAPIYLIVNGSSDWFLLLATLGRIVLFTFLWVSTYFLASKFKRYIEPLIVAGLLFVAPSLTKILVNPSDALFASTSAMALSMTISYYHRRRIKDIWLASLFMGLAALARNDGLFLFPIFVFFAIYMGRRHSRLRELIPAILIPFLTLLIAYLIAHGITTGSFSIGVGYRGYSAFEWSQHTITGGSIEEGIEEARRLFGSPEENKNSILRAILRNPAAFMQRVVINISQTSEMILVAYDKRVGPFLFFLCLAGFFTLVRERSYFLLVLLVVWPLHALLYLGFYLRSGFVLLSHFIVLILAAFGASFLVGRIRSPWDKIAWSSPLLGLAIYGGIDGKLAFLASGLIAFVALWIAWLSSSWLGNGNREKSSLALLVIFSAGILLHGSYPFPNFPSLGSSTEAEAVRFLEEHLPVGSNILVPTPLPALASKMTHILAYRVPLQVNSVESLRDWLFEDNIRAIYIDSVFIHSFASLWSLLEEMIGKDLDVTFSGPQERIRILFVRSTNP